MGQSLVCVCSEQCVNMYGCINTFCIWNYETHCSVAHKSHYLTIYIFLSNVSEHLPPTSSLNVDG